MHDKLYIIVRSDLPPGLALAQACHALRLFGAEHPVPERAWYEGSNNLAVLEAPDERALKELAKAAERAGLVAARFHEPDLGNALTAIALPPAAARLLRKLPLALRDAQRAA